MYNKSRLVDFAAFGNRRQIGRIGLQQQSVEWNIANCLAQFFSLPEGHDSGQRNEESHRERSLGERGACCKTMYQPRERAARVLLLQNRDCIFISITRVHDQGQPALPRGINMSAKRSLLRGAWAVFIEVVKAAFADCNDLGMLC